MKTKLHTGLMLAMALAAGCNPGSGSNSQSSQGPRTLSSFDTSSGTNAPVGAHMIRFVDADVRQVLALYQDLSGRSIILSPTLPTTAKITLRQCRAAHARGSPAGA